MRKPLTRTLLAALAAASVVSCGSGGPPPLVPMPTNVPTTPQFAKADDVVAKLNTAGVPCRVTLSNTSAHGSAIDCTATVNGVSFVNVIKVFDPAQYSRDDIGDSISSRRSNHESIVAAGNWYVSVVNPVYAPQVAKALDGVVLPSDELKVPDYPLPAIPASPRYDTVQQLAKALDAAVGCTDQKAADAGSMTCQTGSKVSRTPNCATLQLYPNGADRDKALRTAIAYRGVPAYLATAANWTINLCDYTLADQVAKDLNGVVVSYNGQ